MRVIELGVAAGVTSRPAANSNNVTFGIGRTIGVHARVDPLKWLGVRVMARWEFVSVSFSQGALGLPPGTSYDEPDLDRVSLGVSAEPTWYPIPRLALWGGVGIGWGRTTAQPLHVSGTETAALPIRSAVFVEFPLSVGVRYEVVKNWVVLNLSGHIGFLSDQTGDLENPYSTPGTVQRVVTVQGFPELGTSYGFLAGVGCLL